MLLGRVVGYWFRFYFLTSIVRDDVCSIIATITWFKRILWNRVLCPVVSYTNPSKAGCVFTHLCRATFFVV